MNSVAIGSIIGSETHLNKGSVAARILPGFFPAISPKKTSLSPGPEWVSHSRNKCFWHKTNHTHRDAHTGWPRNNGTRIEKNPFRILPNVDRYQITSFGKWDEAPTLISPDRGLINILKLLAGQLTSGLEQQAWKGLREDGWGLKDAVFFFFV